MADEILIRLPRSQIAEFDPAREQVGLVYASRDLIVLRRVKSVLPGETPKDFVRLFGGPRALLAADLFHGLNLNHATGVAVFEADGIRRDIYLRNGEIVFAQSNQPEDRLGESLIRAGKITQEQLDEAAKSISRERKLGQILVEDGLITPKELFVGVRRQIEEIVWVLFDWPAKYVFYEGFADPESMISINLETQKLIVDGIRRTGSWRHIPVDVPEREIILQLSANPKNLRLNQEEQRLAALIVAGISLRDLIERSGLGQLETYKVVHQMLERDIILIGVRGGQKLTPEDPGVLQMVENFQEVLDRIFSIVRDRAPDTDMLTGLNTFFEGLPEELSQVFGTVRFDQHGKLDAQAIAANVKQIAGNGRGKLLKAFNEILYFTLFESKHVLSDEDSREIMKIIETMEIF